MPGSTPPPLAHRILWSLDDALFTLSLTYSIRRWMLRDLLQEQQLVRLERESQVAQRRALRQSLDYLQRAAYIVHQPKGRRMVWRLTLAGRVHALISAIRTLGRLPTTGQFSSSGRRRWIVLFDIPEELRCQRTLLRRVLYGLKGRFVQRSAFLLTDPDSIKLLRHVIRIARLRPYVWMAEVKS